MSKSGDIVLPDGMGAVQTEEPVVNRTVWRVANWVDNFETPYTRYSHKVDRTLFQNSHSGLSYRRLMEFGREGALAFAGFVVTVELLMTHLAPRYGFLTKDGSIDGRPLDVRDLCLRTGMTKTAIRLMFKHVTTELVGWLVPYHVSVQVVDNERVVFSSVDGVISRCPPCITARGRRYLKGKIDVYNTSKRLGGTRARVKEKRRELEWLMEESSNAPCVATPGDFREEPPEPEEADRTQDAGAADLDPPVEARQEDMPPGVPARKCTVEDATVLLRNVHGEPVGLCRFVAEQWMDTMDSWADGWKRMGSWQASVKAFWRKHIWKLRKGYSENGGRGEEHTPLPTTPVIKKKCRVCGGEWNGEDSATACSCEWSPEQGTVEEWTEARIG